MAYRGQVVEIPLGQGGLISRGNSGQAPPETLLQAGNVTFEDGAIRKEGGARKYNASPVSPPSIEAGWDWWPDATTQVMIIAASDGVSVYLMRDHNGDGVFTTMAAGGPTLGAVPMFVEGGAEEPGDPKKLFLFAKTLPSQSIIGNAETSVPMSETQMDPPPRVVAALPSAGQGVLPGSVDVGTHQYIQVYETADGQTTGSVPSDPVFVGDNSQVGIVQVFFEVAPPNVTMRRLFRSQVGGGGPFRFHSEIEPHITSIIDNRAFSSLTVEEPPETNTTKGRPLEWKDSSWPSLGCIHEGRLWADGGDGHRLYYSTTTDHENFMSEGAGSLSIYPGEGQYIVGLKSWNGLLVVWKYPKGIYTVDTRDVNVENWRVNRLSTSFGSVNHSAQAVVENDIVFLDSTGDIQLLSAVDTFANLGGQSLSKAAQMNQYLQETIETPRLPYARMVYYARKREVHLGISSKGWPINNIRIVLDGNQADRPRFRVSDRDVAQSLWLYTQQTSVQRTQRLVAGDASGFVWLLDDPEKTKDGAAYASVFQTMWTDLSYVSPGLAVKDKNLDFLELAFNPTGAFPLLVSLWVDGRLVSQGTHVFIGPGSMELGDWQLGEGALPDPSAVLIRRIRLHGSGRRISLEVANGAAAEDFSIARAFLSFRTSDERVR